MPAVEQVKKDILSSAKTKGIELKFSEVFIKAKEKIKDSGVIEKLYKQILKLVNDPLTGKPMRFSRKGEREVYLGSLRLYYCFYEKEKILRFVEISHKDKQ
jgi:hypothetical protein